MSQPAPTQYYIVPTVLELYVIHVIIQLQQEGTDKSCV